MVKVELIKACIEACEAAGNMGFTSRQARLELAQLLADNEALKLQLNGAHDNARELAEHRESRADRD